MIKIPSALAGGISLNFVLMMNKYKITVAYDGTNYFGWQSQPDQITIVDVLEKSFKDVFKQTIQIIGASRTDAGVHSLGQIAHFVTRLKLDPEKLRFAWNNVLPVDINIRSIELVDNHFHSRYNVRYKIYYYHLFTQRPLPIFARYGYYPAKKFSPSLLEAALHIFLGTHDFRSFSTGYEKTNTVRTIDAIRIVYIKKYKAYRIIVIGPGFLRYMIRRIIGAALDIASWANRTPEQITKALEEKNPQQHFSTVPPQGLILRKIVYKR